jgi:hypothetical protein
MQEMASQVHGQPREPNGNLSVLAQMAQNSGLDGQGVQFGGNHEHLQRNGHGQSLTSSHQPDKMIELASAIATVGGNFTHQNHSPPPYANGGSNGESQNGANGHEHSYNSPTRFPYHIARHPQSQQVCDQPCSFTFYAEKNYKK